MRKMLWWGCVIGAVYFGAVIGSACYVYTHPDSALARSAQAGLDLVGRYNPLVVGGSATGLNSSVWSGGETVAAKPADEAECAEEPADENEGNFDLLAELSRFVSPVWTKPCDTIEPPVAADEACEAQVAQDGVAIQAAGWVGGVKCRVMPPCKPDDDEACSSGAMWEFVGRAFEQCRQQMRDAAEKRWLTYWMGMFSSPSQLDGRGDVEGSEPNKADEPADCKEDPNREYHHSGCPYTGACPYSGRMPSCTPPAAEPKNAAGESHETMKPDDSDEDFEESDYMPVPAAIDTMEFRDSDRTWEKPLWPFPL
jgi:hypothetical protein